MNAVLSREPDYDAIIIGGGIGGLVAAAYLARARAKTLLLEASDRMGGGAQTSQIADGFKAPLLAHAVYALDRRMLRELTLDRHGLDFAVAGMKLVALKAGGAPIVFPGDGLLGGNETTTLDLTETAAYGRYRWKALKLAQRLRPLWEGATDYMEPPDEPLGESAIARRLGLSARNTERFSELIRISATAYVGRFFESDALKTALAFDAGLEGRAPSEAGSALALLWRLAQESCGVQAATSQPRGSMGAIVAALLQVATKDGAELRTGTPVASIVVEDGRAAGVTLASGETVRASAIVSNLDAGRTLLGLVPPGAIAFGAAAAIAPPSRIAEGKVLLALNGPPPFAGLPPSDLRGRLVIAERPESAAEAKGAALTGELPPELVMEATVPTAADPSLAPEGGHVLSLIVRYLPRAFPSGGGEVLKTRVISALEAYAPGVRDRIVASQVLTPETIASGTGESAVAPRVGRLLSSYRERVQSVLPGLLFCGGSAEPVNAVSGQAGRIAASYVIADLKRAKRGRT